MKSPLTVKSPEVIGRVARLQYGNTSSSTRAAARFS